MVGLVAFANDSGLGNQTRNLYRMLKPEKVLIINSSPFSSNKTQHFDWYDGNTRISRGFPNNEDIAWLVDCVDSVFTCENPYNFSLFAEASRLDIKSYCQTNFEFCDNFANPALPLPDLFLMPSYWMLNEMNEKYPGRVRYLPPPLFMSDFKKIRDTNLGRKGKKKFLHVVGTLASNDRNGTLSLLQALRYSKEDYELWIHTQHDLPDYYMVADERVKYTQGTYPDHRDIYKDFDALILPRRYGGLCLPMNEGLACGLPVIMPNCSPNNQILPYKWLTKTESGGSFMAKNKIPTIKIDHKSLAQKIDWLASSDITKLKDKAVRMAKDNFDVSILLPKYKEIMEWI